MKESQKRHKEREKQFKLVFAKQYEELCGWMGRNFVLEGWDEDRQQLEKLTFEKEPLFEKKEKVFEWMIREVQLRHEMLAERAHLRTRDVADNGDRWDVSEESGTVSKKQHEILVRNFAHQLEQKRYMLAGQMERNELLTEELDEEVSKMADWLESVFENV